jgi:hypothetical protein
MNPQSVIETLYRKGATLDHKNDEFKDIGICLAESERDYNIAISKKMLELKAGGIASSACEKMAKGDPVIAALKFEVAKQTILLDACKRATRAIDTQIDIMRSDLSFQKAAVSHISQTQEA